MLSATAAWDEQPELALCPLPRITTARAQRRSIAAGIDVGKADPGVLFLRWRQFGEERAREALIERFLPLARRLARRYARSSDGQDDLVQIASVGLVKAIDRFDPARGVAFTSFAVPTILGELKRHFRDSGWAVHVSRRAQELALKVEAAGELLADGTGRLPTVGEVAGYLGLRDEEVLEGLTTARAHAAISLDAPRSTYGVRESYIDTLGQEDRTLALVDITVPLKAAIEQLPEREQWILQQRFVEDLTQTAIADRIGISQMQVSRLLRRSLQRLRELTEGTQPHARTLHQ